MSKSNMATRDPNIVSESTEYQLHKSQITSFSKIQHKIIDYTEHRLLQKLKTINDSQKKQTLVELINNYRKGTVVVAWRRGDPVWLFVTKEI